MADLSSFHVTGSNNPNKQVSVTRFNSLLDTVSSDITATETDIAARPTSAALAATTGAALIGETGGGTLQAKLNALDTADSARPTSATLAASGGSALLGHLPPGTGAVAETAQAALRRAPLYPEQFGAVADGTTDDAAAISLAITAAAANNRPLRFTLGKTYAVGSTGWVGFLISSALTIDGNGATIKALVVPSQGFTTGVGNPVFRSASAGTVKVSNLNFDLNGLQVAALDFHNTIPIVEGCAFRNGYATGVGNGSNLSWGIYLTQIPRGGRIAGNIFNVLGYGIYSHTDATMEVYGIEISGNTVTDLGADFVVGIFKESRIVNNEIDGCFSGIALSALASTGTFSSDVVVSGNLISNFFANGVQTDVIGAITARKIVISDNIASASGGTSSTGAIYVVGGDDFVIRGNRGDAVRAGIVFDFSSNGVIEGNQFTAAATSTVGISVPGENGVCSNVVVQGNLVRSFATNVNIASGLSAVTNVSVIGNATTGGTRGIWVQTGAAGVTLDHNRCSGATTSDIQVAVQNVQVGENNQYATQSGVQYWPFTDLDTTPSILGRKMFRAAYSAVTTITAFDDIKDGDEFTIYSANGNLTIAHGGVIEHPASANITIPALGYITYSVTDTIARVKSKSFT